MQTLPKDLPGRLLKKEYQDKNTVLILRKEAEQDLKDAYEWYESQQKNLGVTFISEIDAAINRIEGNPQAHAKIYKNIRRALCKRFPYAVYFIETNQNNIVYWRSSSQAASTGLTGTKISITAFFQKEIRP